MAGCVALLDHPSAVFPDTEGIETSELQLQFEALWSAVFPDTEGIETFNCSSMITLL